MKRHFSRVGVAGAVVFLSAWAYARDLGVLVLPVHQGKFTSTLVYERLKIKDDFDTRGRAEFKADVVGSHFSYGLTDQIALALKGGVFVDPQVEAQGTRWESGAGYLYGVDFSNEIFPATEVRPGVQLSMGMTGFQVPLDRSLTGGTVTLIDHKMSGIEYHGAVLSTARWGRAKPYAGVRGFGSSVYWRDNNPTAGNPARITGHAHGNISVVIGCPMQVTRELRLQVEGRFVSETAVTAGFTIAAF